MRVSKEEVRCDLDRVRSSIVSSSSGIVPTNLKIINDKYVNGLRNLTYKPGDFDIDENAVKVVTQDDISFQNNLQPIRY